MDVDAYNGSSWSAAKTAVVTTAAPPVVTLQNKTVVANASIPASSLIASVSDPNNYTITGYSFWDEGSGGGYLSLNGVKQASGQWINVSAANLSTLQYVGGTSAGSEIVDVAAYDGLSWSSSNAATVTTTAAQSLPVVTLQNKTVGANATISASSLIASVSDPNNYTITAYGFWDEGSGGGYFSLNGVKQASGQWINVSAANLSTLLYVGGTSAGSENVDVDAYNGFGWSAYKTAVVTTTAPQNLPVVSVQSQTVTTNASLKALSLITGVTDPNGYAITYYDFRDNGSGGGYFSLNGATQAAGQWITVSASDLAQAKLVYVGGATAGSENVDIAAWDGANWSNYQTATITTTASLLPVVTAQNQTVNANASIPASSLVASASDPNGHAISAYGFWDEGSDGGYLSLNGVKLPAGQWIDVSAADLSKLTYVGGGSNGTEIVDVTVYNGSSWSGYSPAAVTTKSVLPAVIRVSNQTLDPNTSIPAASLIASVSDPNKYAITSYDFRDDGGGAGYFTLNGVKQTVGTWIAIAASDLQNLAYVSGATAGTETVDIAAWNGLVWSAYGTANVITKAAQTLNHPDVSTSNQSVNVGASIPATSLIASTSDPNGYAITYYDFRDNGSGGGYFQLNGVQQTSGNWITVSSTDLSKLIYVGGLTPGYETASVAVWDGQLWSNVATATVTTVASKNAIPVIAAQDQTVNVNETIQASSLIASATDPNGYVITDYGFRDDGGGAGYFTLNGVKQTMGNWITVSSADLEKLVYVGGGTVGSETVDVAAWDGMNWSNYQTATVTTKAAQVALPLITLQAQTVDAGASIQASALIASVSDPSGYAITSYQFRDDSGGGGYFALNGTAQASGNWIAVSAADLSKLTYVGGAIAGSESVDVAVYDGHSWSSAATTSVTTTTANANPVLAQLSDAGVKADVTATIANNTLSYAGMLKILDDVEVGGVTASEMASLKVLQSSFNKANGIQVSSYVSYISDKLINGDPANAHWTGGATQATVLGNLQVGSTQAQLDKLIQKWFLGGDLPAPLFGDSGNIVATYLKDTDPLYNSTGLPSINDINQGYLGDCYLLASLAEIAQDEPSVIKSMITDNGNGSYGIRFFIQGSPVYVTVNNYLPVYSGTNHLIGNSANDTWSCLIEKAYAQLNEEPGFLDHPAGNIYFNIKGGYADPITQITGRSVTAYDSSYYSSNSWANLKSTFVAAIQSGMEVDWASRADTFANSTGLQEFIKNHMFSGLGYDSATGNFIVRNPWGVEPGQKWLTQFEASIADLYSDHGTIFIASGGMGGSPGKSAAVLATAASALSDFLAGLTTSAVTVSDTAANVQSRLDDLQAMTAAGKLTSIGLTDASVPTLVMTSTQESGDAQLLSKIAGSFNLSVTGSASNDVMAKGAGSDTFNGNGGIDSVVFHGSRANYALNPVSTSFSVQDKIGSDGTAMLTNVERLLFSDTKLAIDMNASQPGGESALLIGSILGKSSLTNKALVGQLLSFFDAGNTMHDAASVLVNAGIMDQLAGGSSTGAYVNLIFHAVTGQTATPDLTAALAPYIDSYGYSKADFLTIIAGMQVNQDNVGLVGLAQTGLEFS